MLETMGKDKNKVILIDATYGGFFRKEGYYKVDIGLVDTTTIDKGYVTLYVVDKDNNEVNRVNLRIRPTNEPMMEVPLEKMIRLSMGDSMEEGYHCYEIDLDELIGVECQIKVERINDYYNVTDVFPMDEELGEFVSYNTRLANRIPKGIFDKN
ncbi:hypothetical protein J5S49_04900 [Virgibacillus halodenitrificans]|uniref:hypothetical protein n=1 Tax=Virgibacillus halodenitrificans TaxID=1482 RepID=UPI001F162E08|nr:hypothetical protein [Virgibacillus halodenitrificans]MCG1027620.1 hypothetical protein [Virgibacillus halodenitrificans]